MNKLIYKELIAFHPGYYIKDMIEAEGMSQDELAKRLQTSSKNVSDLLNGRINLTDEMALRLSIVFGTSVSMWLNLNQGFIEEKLEIERRMQEDAECDLAKEIDYSFWVNLNLVEPMRKTAGKVRELQRYFRISSLEVLKKRDFLVQYNKTISDVKDKDVLNANAWVQTAINVANQMNISQFDKKKLTTILPQIRELTLQNPQDVKENLQKLLAECGVAFVMLPNLKCCHINGAVKWLSKEKVMLAMNSAQELDDKFWFALFHEIGHVMQQRLKVLIVSENRKILEKDGLLERLEVEANQFAEEQMSLVKEVK